MGHFGQCGESSVLGALRRETQTRLDNVLRLFEMLTVRALNGLEFLLGFRGEDPESYDG